MGRKGIRLSSFIFITPTASSLAPPFALDLTIRPTARALCARAVGLKGRFQFAINNVQLTIVVNYAIKN